MTKSSVQVLIVDDHPIIRTGLRNILRSAPDIHIAGEAGDGLEALDFLESKTPDLLLLDIRMPRMDGPELIEEIHQRRIPVQVLVISGYDDPEYVYGLFSQGIAGYLLKDEASDTIVQAIRGIHAGERGWISTRISSRMTWYMRDFKRKPDSLTAREVQVLAEVADGRSNQEIGFRLGISEKTVEKHLQTIMGKLGVDSRVEAAVLAIRSQLLDVPVE